MMSRSIVVATIRFKDKDKYDRYAAAFPAVFQGSGGSMLAAAEDPVQLSGPSADIEKIVVMRFDSEDAAHKFLHSPDYRRIAEDRGAGADVTSWIVKAF
jgi:uncharacterized protein (DUF1330 family)